MNIFKAYIAGLTSLFSSKRLWLLLYVLNFLFALVIAFPLNSYLTSVFGNSLSLEQSFSHFDYTLFGDFLNEYGSGFMPILNQSVVVIGLFLLFSIFLMGGIINVLKHQDQPNSFAAFWWGCGYYFWRLFRLTIYFLLIHGGLLFLFFTIYKSMTNDLSIFKMETDMVMISAFKILAPIYAVLAAIAFMIHDYIKIHLLYNETILLFKPVGQSLWLTLRKFIPILLLYILNVLTLLAFCVAYWFARKNFVPVDFSTIAIIFGIGQAFIFIRIGLKIMNLGSIHDLYKRYQ